MGIGLRSVPIAVLREIVENIVNDKCARTVPKSCPGHTCKGRNVWSPESPPLKGGSGAHFQQPKSPGFLLLFLTVPLNDFNGLRDFVKKRGIYKGGTVGAVRPGSKCARLARFARKQIRTLPPSGAVPVSYALSGRGG